MSTCGFASTSMPASVPSSTSRAWKRPNKRADKVNMVIFRENTEDVYCGIEFKSGSDKAKQLLELLQRDGLQSRAHLRVSASSP